MPLSALILPHVSAQAAAQYSRAPSAAAPRVSASAAVQNPRAPQGAALPASDKSALSNPSAAPFHISYFISHNFQRPQGAKERIKK